MDLSSTVFLFLLSLSSLGAQAKPPDSSISALLVFGDSTVDPGNNNYIQTGMRSNFPPYGMDLPSRTPTGRFCNGRLTTDFIASYLGLKEYVPPYLNESLTLEELTTGVSFASAGTGYDPFTSQIVNVIPVQKQLEYFKEYKARLEVVMGTDGMEDHIRKAGFIVSCGTNDLGENYFAFPVRPRQYSVAEYQNFLIEKMRTFLQGLVDMGARKIGIVGLPPIGCIPIIVTLKSTDVNIETRPCVEYYSTVAKQFNQKLQNEMLVMQRSLATPGLVMVFADIYEPLLEIIRDYKKLGFEEWRRGCCGSGLLEFGYSCNAYTPICGDASEFVFWDSVHPTEKVYQLLFSTFRDKIDAFT